MGECKNQYVFEIEKMEEVKEAPYDIVADRHVGRGSKKGKRQMAFDNFKKSCLFFAL